MRRRIKIWIGLEEKIRSAVSDRRRDASCVWGPEGRRRIRKAVKARRLYEGRTYGSAIPSKKHSMTSGWGEI